MRILVCFKTVPNWDKVLERDFDAFTQNSDIAYAGQLINCFDESALETALRLKDAAAQSGQAPHCAAVTAGALAPGFAESLYAAGFDEVLQISMTNREFNPAAVAENLAACAQNHKADLVLTGWMAGMAETALVPYLLAEALGMPLIAEALAVEWAPVEESPGGRAHAVRVSTQNRQGVWQSGACLPLVLSMGNSTAVLRAVPLRARLQAKGRAPLVVEGVGRLLLEPAQGQERGQGPEAEQGQKQKGAAEQLYRPHNARQCQMLAAQPLSAVARVILDNFGAGTSAACGQGNAIQCEQHEVRDYPCRGAYCAPESKQAVHGKQERTQFSPAKATQKSLGCLQWGATPAQDAGRAGISIPPDIDAVYYTLSSDSSASYVTSGLCTAPAGELWADWNARRPALTLLPPTPQGRHMLAMLARRTGLAAMSGVHSLALQNGRLLVRKSVCGANLEWERALALPALVGLDAIPPLKSVKVVSFEARRPDWLTGQKLVEPAQENGLESAKLAVLCGAGATSKECCEKARRLAQKLGAGFGITRAALLNGWGSAQELVGQSGLQIAPKVCLVLGASGAGAFMAGLRQAGRIIAVNRDSAAPIFAQADVGICADANALLDVLDAGVL